MPVWRHAVDASLCGAVALVIASCTLGQRDPEVVGVIATSERRDDVTIVTLEDGTTLDVDFSVSEGLAGSAGGLDPGTLWLSDAAGAWYMTLDATSFAPLGSREPRDCFFIGSPGTRDDGHIQFDNGLRLPLVPDFDPGSIMDNRFDYANAGFCVDEAGRLLFYDG